MDDYERTGETEAQKLDRNWDELLQELRVSQTGVQILTGFLLTLPLQPKFAELSDFQRGSYVVAISLSILATCLRCRVSCEPHRLQGMMGKPRSVAYSAISASRQ